MVSQIETFLSSEAFLNSFQIILIAGLTLVLHQGMAHCRLSRMSELPNRSTLLRDFGVYFMWYEWKRLTFRLHFLIISWVHDEAVLRYQKVIVFIFSTQ